MRKKSFTKPFFALGVILFICFGISCTSSKEISKDYLYFQNNLDTLENNQLKDNTIKVNDILSIQITSKTLNQDQTLLFNTVPSGATSPNSGYMVGIDGNIDLPILGSIKAAGLTKDQLQSAITEKLLPYVKDPYVIVKFSQFNINVLGEVKAPGAHLFQAEKVSILDAISASGDLTDYGKREDVMVIREENGKRKYYKVDLRSGDIFKSPVYQLQHNDIVYVGANEMKLKSLNTTNSYNSFRNLQIIIGFVSIAASLTYLIVNITKK